MNISVFENKDNILNLCCQELLTIIKTTWDKRYILIIVGENWQSPYFSNKWYTKDFSI